MPRKPAAGRTHNKLVRLVNGRVVEMDKHGYGKIALLGGANRVHFKVSQVTAPKGYEIDKRAKIGRTLLNTPVKVSARSVGGTLLARSVEIDASSKKLYKIGMADKTGKAAAAASKSERALKYRK